MPDDKDKLIAELTEYKTKTEPMLAELVKYKTDTEPVLTKLTKANEELAGVTSKSKDELATAQVQLKTLTNERNELTTKAAKADDVLAQLKELTTKHDALNARMLTNTKARLTALGFTEADIKDRTVDQLDLMETTAMKVASRSILETAKGFGMGNGGNGEQRQLTPVEVAEKNLAALRKK